jgi:hypothetical protein
MATELHSVAGGFISASGPCPGARPLIAAFSFPPSAIRLSTPPTKYSDLYNPERAVGRALVHSPARFVFSCNSASPNEWKDFEDDARYRPIAPFRAVWSSCANWPFWAWQRRSCNWR